VDLAIEDDPRGLILVGKRLMSGGEIDNAEAAMTECCLPIHEPARIIWPAMRDHIAHARDPIAVVRVQPFDGNDSRDSAHTVSSCGPERNSRLGRAVSAPPRSRRTKQTAGVS